MKRCPDCGIDKPQDAFGLNRSRPDGLSFYCLECFRRRSNAWYRQSRERLGKRVRDHSGVPEGFRWCPTCEKPVPQSEYVRSRTSASGFGSQCNACHKHASSDGYWRRTYGLTRSEVDELRTAQGGRCAICGDSGPHHLDHDHETGSVRSLLCQRCNLGLGLYRDDAALLRAAADYVERHRVLAGNGGPGVRATVGGARTSSPMARWRLLEASPPPAGRRPTWSSAAGRVVPTPAGSLADRPVHASDQQEQPCDTAGEVDE